MVYSCNGLVFNLKKDGNSDKCYNVHESWGYYAKRSSQSQIDKYHDSGV